MWATTESYYSAWEVYVCPTRVHNEDERRVLLLRNCSESHPLEWKDTSPRETSTLQNFVPPHRQRAVFSFCGGPRDTWAEPGGDQTKPPMTRTPIFLDSQRHTSWDSRWCQESQWKDQALISMQIRRLDQVVCEIVPQHTGHAHVLSFHYVVSEGFLWLLHFLQHQGDAVQATKRIRSSQWKGSQTWFVKSNSQWAARSISTTTLYPLFDANNRARSPF